MNTPLIDEAVGNANVSALREALEACAQGGSTQTVRTATRVCMEDRKKGFLSFEACLAIAAAHRMFNPGPLGLLCAKSFRAEALADKHYDPGVDEIYTLLILNVEQLRLEA